MSAFFDFGFLTCSPKHFNFVRGWIFVVMIVNYPYIISLTKSFRFEGAVMISTSTFKQKVLALLRGLMLVGCLRYQVAPLRCLSILGSCKSRQIFFNLKHFEKANFCNRAYFNIKCLFSYIYGANLVSGRAIC